MFTALLLLNSDCIGCFSDEYGLIGLQTWIGKGGEVDEH
jgi:hypothetical protein